jgi:hypothetical protein
MRSSVSPTCREIVIRAEPAGVGGTRSSGLDRDRRSASGRNYPNSTQSKNQTHGSSGNSCQSQRNDHTGFVQAACHQEYCVRQSARLTGTTAPTTCPCRLGLLTAGAAMDPNSLLGITKHRSCSSMTLGLIRATPIAIQAFKPSSAHL